MFEPVQSLVLLIFLLLTGSPSENYWELLAEQRRVALEETLQENEKLYKKIARLEEENKICKEMLKEQESLVDVLKVSLGSPNLYQSL